MRAYLTGASGFVGGWLTKHLEAMGDEVCSLTAGIDITESEAVALGDLAGADADVVYHLAALTHVGRSWQEPAETLRVNSTGTLAILEAARQCAKTPAVMLISSAEVYGGGDGRPITEDAPLRPVSPYAASKVAAELLGVQAYFGRGLEVVRVRPFNHVGPGQDESFVVSALAQRVVAAERSGNHEIRVGNLAAQRDFTDVRDVVRAYRLLAELGAAGEVYNVSSGIAVPIATLLGELVGLAKVELTTVEDPALFRPIDLPIMVGDAHKLVALTGWKPEIERSATLRDILEYYRAKPVQRSS